jgi:hypothetical protein
MTTSTELSTTWLVSLLNSLGSTGDEVAATLRKASVKGTPASIWNDPVAVYISARTRDLVPPDTVIEVVVTAEEIVVSATVASASPDDRHEVTASTPGAVEDFLDRFDAGEDYHDLAEIPGT